MLLPIWMWTCFSGVAIGGVHGKVVGIARLITTGAGLIMVMPPVSIMMWNQVGEDSITTMIGMGTRGTTNEFLTETFDRTGVAGTMIDIGKGTELGASRTINLDQRERERNLDARGKWNIIRGLRSGGMSKKGEELGSSDMSQKGEDLRSSNVRKKDEDLKASSISKRNEDSGMSKKGEGLKASSISKKDEGLKERERSIGGRRKKTKGLLPSTCYRLDQANYADLCFIPHRESQL